MPFARKQQLIQKVQRNFKGKDYAVGDLHGMFSMLEEKLQQINFDKTKDRLFCTGDLIDRGAESYKFVEYLKQPWFYSVQGNHEAMLLEYVQGSTTQYLYSHNGGDWFIDLEDDKKLVQKYVKACQQLPLIIEVGCDKEPIVIVHSQLPSLDYADARKLLLDEPKDYYLQKSVDTCQWSRDWAMQHAKHKKVLDVKGVKAVVSGHTPWESPQRSGNWFSIDTGACYTEDKGYLTVLDLSTFEFL